MTKTQEFIQKTERWLKTHNFIPADITTKLKVDEVSEFQKIQLQGFGYKLERFNDSYKVTVDL